MKVVILFSPTIERQLTFETLRNSNGKYFIYDLDDRKSRRSLSLAFETAVRMSLLLRKTPSVNVKIPFISISNFERLCNFESSHMSAGSVKYMWCWSLICARESRKIRYKSTMEFFFCPTKYT